MAFQNPSRGDIEKLLRAARTVAVVGLSDSPRRPSHGVARALQQFGYRVIPVNPTIESALGERSVPSLDAAVASLRPGERIDIVDVFRRPEHVAAVVEDVIRLGLPALWLQDGVIDAAAAGRARDHGVFTVMDRCLYRDRAALSVSSPHAD
jgi:uncharacterized protein